MAFAHAIGSYPYWCVVMFLCERAQTPNASTKRYQQTLPANATSNGAFTYYNNLHTEYLTSYTNTLNLLIIKALLSVRYYKFYLHATYTPYILPHGTNTRGRYHGIVEQKRLLLRQIVLRPCGVKPAAYVQTDCATAGWCV